MKLISVCALLLSLCGIAAAEDAKAVKVEVTGMHLCCGACGKGVEAAIKSAGAEGAVDLKKKTASISAKDAATAQKALDAIAAAGYYGATDNKEIVFKDNSGTPAGKVKDLSFTGSHLCCGGCIKALKAAVAAVPGATLEDPAKAGTFSVKGEFEGAALMKALHEQGLQATLKK